MNDSERRVEVVLTAAVVSVFAAFWVMAWALSDPPEFSSQYAVSAVMLGIIATPWVFAVRLLRRAWRARNPAGQAPADGPARLLAVAVATLPEARREWGRAMAAELDHVTGRSSRWSFAAGCLRAALFPPCAARVPVLLVAALSAVGTIVAGRAIGRALPEMQVFAVAFVGLVGAALTLAVLRSRRVSLVLPGPAIMAAGVAGVAACIAGVSYFLAMHPAAREHFPPALAVAFAALMSGCLWLTLIPPRALASSRLARGLGLGAASALGLGFLVTSRLTIHTLGGPLIWVLFAPPVIFFAASALAAASGRSFRAGVQAAVWTALLGTMIVFAGWLPEALYRYEIDARLLLDGEMGYTVEENLDDTLWMLLIPTLGLPFGVIGAAAGRRLRAAPPFHPPAPETRRCRA